MCDHGVLMTCLSFECQLPCFRRIACGIGIRRHSHAVWIYVFVIICVFLVWSGGKLVFDGSKSVLECSSIGHCSGQFFCARMRAFFGIRLLPPCSLGGFSVLTEYGCGIRLSTSVRPRHALSEAPGRPRQNDDLGLPMASWRAFGKRLGLRAWFWGFDVAKNTTCLARKISLSNQFSTCLAHKIPHWNMVHLWLWMVKRLSIFWCDCNNPYRALLCACSL